MFLLAQSLYDFSGQVISCCLVKREILTQQDWGGGEGGGNLSFHISSKQLENAHVASLWSTLWVVMFWNFLLSYQLFCLKGQMARAKLREGWIKHWRCFKRRGKRRRRRGKRRRNSHVGKKSGSGKEEEAHICHAYMSRTTHVHLAAFIEPGILYVCQKTILK